MSKRIQVAIIGAGPAGLFAAEKLTQADIAVALFNRDIKPGGMAEYGIYPEKHQLKDGLRKQFERILSYEQVHYFGNTCVGEDQSLTIPRLLEWGFSAVLICCGAQGTKWLGIPGENLEGVIHSKNLVFHYNRLPPYCTAPIKIGKKAVVVGAGNVMADVTRYLLGLPQMEKIHVCVRRGPAEVKFTAKELESIIGGMDMDALEHEFERVKPVMVPLGQDPEVEKAVYLKAFGKAGKTGLKPLIEMHFLVSPVKIEGDEQGGVNTVVLEENTLVLSGEKTSARGLGTHRSLAADTVVFAIGDRVEERLGVPVSGNEYRHVENPRYPVEGQSYEVEAPGSGQAWKGVFVAGWSRLASSGLVGNAKKDGVNGAEAVEQYLREERPGGGLLLDELESRLSSLPDPVVQQRHLARLLAEERKRAGGGPIEYAKFTTNAEMLQVMGLQ